MSYIKNVLIKNLTISGLKPSSPPWKGTVNFNWLAVGPVVPSVDIEALNEPVHKLELLCQK